MKQKINRIMPILALLVSTACVSQTMPSEKKNLQSPEHCSEIKADDIDGKGYECVDIFNMKLEEQINQKYENFFNRIAAKDVELSGVSKEYFSDMRKQWGSYVAALCSDPTTTTKERPLAGSYLRICRFKQNLYHLKSLEHFEKALHFKNDL
ncbi:hypothetical protein [Neisseria weixii]|uniref:hypothetical protein n=1 Tax=Neisseria weixii TaxID=1853276 RepID=UPI0035A1BA73